MTMIERVARAIRAERDNYGSDTDLARAAIEAMREPTDDMIDAIRFGAGPGECWRDNARIAWESAVDVALGDEVADPSVSLCMANRDAALKEGQ